MYNTNRFVLQELGRLWRVSDCEELVGVTNRGRWGNHPYRILVQNVDFFHVDLKYNCN